MSNTGFRKNVVHDLIDNFENDVRPIPNRCIKYSWNGRRDKKM